MDGHRTFEAFRDNDFVFVSRLKIPKQRLYADKSAIQSRRHIHTKLSQSALFLGPLN